MSEREQNGAVALRIEKLGTGDIDVEEFLACAASRFDGTSPVALVFSPSWAGFASFDTSGKFAFPPKASVILRDIFEVRIFNGKGEARWVRHGDASGKGSGVFLDEDVCPNNDSVGVAVKESYVLWGTVTQEQKHDDALWLRLFEHRTGDLFVPLMGERSKKASGNVVVLETRVYFGVDPAEKHGNLSVLGERLVCVRETSPSEISPGKGGLA